MGMNHACGEKMGRPMGVVEDVDVEDDDDDVGWRCFRRVRIYWTCISL